MVFVTIFNEEENIMKIDIDNKLTLAKNAFKMWKDVPFAEKQLLIEKAARLFEARAEEFGAIITREMNKPISQSVSEVKKCVRMMDYYSKVDNILLPQIMESEYQVSEMHFVPKGVVLGVMPWNFPFWQVLRFATPTLLAGNTVVMKHASICFDSGDAIEQIFLEAGFPEGVFQNLKVGHKEVEAILRNPIVRAVSLTGSGPAGGAVAGIAGKEIKKSLLELGGSDAFIVLDDANLEEAAKVGTLARLQNCGQTCVAAKRFIVQDTVADKFTQLVIEEFAEYVPADKFDNETRISGMARPDLADELQKQYDTAVANGAVVIIPLERISDIAFKPGLLKVNLDNPILQEELFGPVGMILVANNDEEIVNIANDIPFGLSNSVWTSDKDRQKYYYLNLESGTVNVNRMTSSDPRFPFGGTKSSGYGLELSELALKEFVDAKMIIVK